MMHTLIACYHPGPGWHHPTSYTVLARPMLHVAQLGFAAGQRHTPRTRDYHTFPKAPDAAQLGTILAGYDQESGET